MSKYKQKILEIKEKIVKEFNPEKIILFGSYAWGNPTDDSDIDFFIIKKSELPRVERQMELRRKLWGSGIPMDLLVYTPEEVKKRLDIEDPFTEYVLKHGKVLYQI